MKVKLLKELMDRIGKVYPIGSVVEVKYTSLWAHSTYMMIDKNGIGFSRTLAEIVK